MVRVFVSQVDTYNGASISKFFAKSHVGGSLEDGGFDEEIDSQPAQKEAGAVTFEVIGTLKDASREKPKWVSEIISNRVDLVPTLTSCDVIIYSILEEPDQIDEATQVVNALHDGMSGFTSPKTFICVSSLLTWARSKPMDPDEPDIPFTEEDYRRRRCHPNFKDHIALEKLVIKLGKTDKLKFMTYVVVAGVLYGEGESMLHHFFKAAWHGNPEALQIYEEGQNIVPTIHINDLASVLVSVADSRPKVRYLVAVDDSQTTLEDLVRAISKNLGSGRVKHVPKEEALSDKNISHNTYDHLLLNLNMEATYVKESMHINWICEEGPVENIKKIVREYKQSRGLIPIKVCVLGPPAVGKTSSVTQLCKHYKLHHIKMADVIKETIDNLERLAARVEVGDEDEESDDQAQQAKERLELLREDLENEEHKGRYSDDNIIEFFKEKLMSMPCQNQGFILDGYPKTYEQAKELFAPNEDAEDEETEGGEDLSSQYNKNIMPDVVVSLNARDDGFLKERVMNLPESVITGTHYTQHEYLSKLSNFRTLNEDDVTVLNYFDELEVHPVHIDVTKDGGLSIEDTVTEIKGHIGEPRNYGPTAEEIAEMEQKMRKIQLEREVREKEERERQESEEKELKEKREREWAETLRLVQEEEKATLEAQSLPLRNFLMKFVMPTLTEGLVEVCKVKPDDPIDYLAEYLFKNNPQID